MTTYILIAWIVSYSPRVAIITNEYAGRDSCVEAGEQFIKEARQDEGFHGRYICSPKNRSNP